MKTTRPPMVTPMQGQMYFYAACRFSKTHSGFAHKAAGPLQERVEQERVESVALWKRVFQTLKGDSALRNTRNTHMCVCLSTNRHSHTHTSLMRAPYIIFVHNLICLSPAVYCAMVTGPTPPTTTTTSPRCRHTFL